MKVTGASPATVDITVFIEVPVETISNVVVPSPGSLPVIKAGTKVKNIRLSDGDHNIDCKIDGFGAMVLKSEFVKKA